VEIIGVIVAGIIIGLLGKFVAPGNRDNIPIWLTIICGIGGVFDRLVHLYRVRRQRQPRYRLGAVDHRDRGSRCAGHDRLRGDRQVARPGPVRLRAL
jgi:hypothetical protein